MVRRLGLNFQGGPGGSITKSSVDRALGGAEAERKRQGSELRSRKPSHGQGHCKDISEAPRSQKGRRRTAPGVTSVETWKEAMWAERGQSKKGMSPWHWSLRRERPCPLAWRMWGVRERAAVGWGS